MNYLEPDHLQAPEGKTFFFPCITLVTVGASRGSCEAGCGFVPLESPKDRGVTVSCTLAGFWAPVQELLCWISGILGLCAQ